MSAALVRRDSRSPQLTCKHQLIDLLARYGIKPESESGGRFIAYLELLEKWGQAFNLVGSLSWDNLEALIEEGIWAGMQYPKVGRAHLDLGSGAGFPAIPMRIVNPGMRLQLVESRSKRAVFLETVSQALNLTGTRVHNCTLSTFLRDKMPGPGWNCVSWKALRLSRKDFESLVGRSAAGTEFWIFHGAEVPVEGDGIETLLHLSRWDSAPVARGWKLSVYLKPE